VAVGSTTVFVSRRGPTPATVARWRTRNGSRLSRTDADASLPLGVAAGACDPVQGRRRSPGVYCGVRSIALSRCCWRRRYRAAASFSRCSPPTTRNRRVRRGVTPASGRTRTTAPRLRLNGRVAILQGHLHGPILDADLQSNLTKIGAAAFLDSRRCAASTPVPISCRSTACSESPRAATR